MGIFNRWHTTSGKHGCTHHEWYVEYGKSICRNCGERRDACPSCGSGDQTLLGENNYGQCDYDSAGGGVDDFIVYVYRCNNCGNVFTATRGSVCGDETPMVEETLKEFLKT